MRTGRGSSVRWGRVSTLGMSVETVSDGRPDVSVCGSLPVEVLGSQARALEHQWLFSVFGRAS